MKETKMAKDPVVAPHATMGATRDTAIAEPPPPPKTGAPADPGSRVPLRGDDPLLSALIVLCKFHKRPVSAEALVAGLPLVDNRLTPEVFLRAARRADLSVGIVKRPLDKISDFVLPAVLLFKDGSNCVLISRDKDTAQIILPESGEGVKRASIADLRARYSGTALFVQPAFSFDKRSEESVIPRVKHWLWDVVWKSWPIYTEVLVASLLSNIIALITPLFTMNVYDRVVPNQAVETLWFLSLGVAFAYLFDFALRALRAYFIDIAGKKTDILLSATIFEKVMGLRLEARPQSVGSFANSMSEFESFRDFITSTTMTALVDLPFLVLFILVIWAIGGEIAWVPVVTLPLALVAGFALQGPLARNIEEMFRYGAQKSATVVEALTGLDTIKYTGAESQMQRRWEQIIGQLARVSLHSRMLSSLGINISTFFQQFASVAVIIIGVYKIGAGEMTTGGLIACTILTGRALAPVGQIAGILLRYQQAKASLGSLEKLMALPVERTPGQNFLQRPHIKGAIQFQGITFSYPNSPIKALENISFRIQPGEHVAIIGRIGSGKSTMQKLILGMYQPQQGTVLVDGVDLRQFDPADIRHNIGYVSQDMMLFYGSVKDNITFGATYVDDATILRAAELAKVTSFVNRHPAGFDMPVGERGENLSRGQRQSVALARAFLLTPSVYLLDEPTSAMDNRSEELIKNSLAEEIQGKTMLLVTHRTSLLSLVDRLIVADEGRIVADGPKDMVLEALKNRQIQIAL